MKTSHIFAAAAAFVLASSAQAALTYNALNYNGLHMNGITGNGFRINGFRLNGHTLSVQKPDDRPSQPADGSLSLESLAARPLLN